MEGALDLSFDRLLMMMMMIMSTENCAGREMYGRRKILKYIFLDTVWFFIAAWTVLCRFKRTNFSPGIVYIPLGHILYTDFTKMQYCIPVDS